jgi:hypothetical protein
LVLRDSSRLPLRLLFFLNVKVLYLPENVLQGGIFREAGLFASCLLNGILEKLAGGGA